MRGASIILFSFAIAASGQVPVPIELVKEPNPSIDFVIPDYQPVSRNLQSNVSIPRFSSTQTNDNLRIIEQDMADFRRNQELKAQILEEADRDFEANRIYYEFPPAAGKGKQHFYNALKNLIAMIDGTSPLSIKKAVFLVEHAYDTTLRYDDFQRQLQSATNVIGLKLAKDKILPNDNLGKVMTLFRFMADTIKVYSPKGERFITSYPKTYDFDDFWGRNDYHKMFVSKLLKEGNGQCHSLPLLFLILCEEIKADASLSFSPNHSYVKFKDKAGNWHNLELTNGMLASDQFLIQTGYVKAEALQSKIYLEPQTKKEVIVQCINDLALGYTKKYGYDPFVWSCTNVAIANKPNSITAHQINANYYYELSGYILAQYRAHRWNRQMLEKDEMAMKIINSATGANKHIDQLGYSDMPPEAYEAWLRSMQKEYNRQMHIREASILNGMIEKR